MVSVEPSACDGVADGPEIVGVATKLFAATVASGEIDSTHRLAFWTVSLV
jgi:hypothetical protein